MPRATTLSTHLVPFMSPKEFPQFLNAADPVVEVLETYHVTREFYHEIQYRQEKERYCQWYYAIAQHHQEELRKMQGDLNILGWFRRKRR